MKWNLLYFIPALDEILPGKAFIFMLSFNRNIVYCQVESKAKSTQRPSILALTCYQFSRFLLA